MHETHPNDPRRPSHTHRPLKSGMCQVFTALLVSLLLGVPCWAQTRLGAFERQIDGLTRVDGLDYDASGALYALDNGAGLVRVFDASGGTRRTIEFDDEPLAGGSGLAVGSDGKVFVSESARHRVLMRRPEGNIITVATLGARLGQVNDPRGLDISGDRLVVADTGNKRVQLFEIHGDEAIPTVIETGKIDHPFITPVGVAIHEATGRIFVADRDTHRIYRFSPDGAIQMYFGGYGDAPGLLNAPADIDIRGDRLYVTDSRNHRVQVFDTEGGFLYWWGLHTFEPHDGEGRLHYPDSIAIHPSDDRIALGEGFEDRVQLFGPETEVSRAKREEDRMVSRGIGGHYGQKLDAAGDLMALIEPETARVLIFDTSREIPIEITRLGGYGRGFGRLVAPSAVAIDDERQRILVTDEAKGSLLVYSLDRDPDADIRFDPRMGRLLREVDLARSGQFVGASLTWPARPVDIEFAPDGTPRVLDRANASILILIDEYDVDARTLGIGFGALELAYPFDMTILPDGRRAITEPDYGTIKVFGDDEWDVKTIRIEGAPDARPTGIEWDGEAFLVTDASNHRLLRVGMDGEVLSSSGGPGRGIGRDAYYKPAGVSTYHSGVFVSDHGNHRLILRESVGEFTHAFGPYKFTDPANKPEGAASEEASSQ